MNPATSLSQDKAGDITRDKALAAIREKVAIGIPVKRACEQVGVIRSTYYRWEDEEKEKGQPSAGIDPSTSTRLDTSSGVLPDSVSPTPRAKAQKEAL